MGILFWRASQVSQNQNDIWSILRCWNYRILMCEKWEFHLSENHGNLLFKERSQCCKMESLLSPKFFRQSNYLVILLVNDASFSRNFYQKTVRVNLSKLRYTAQCGNCRNSLSHFFHKNFVKAMLLLKNLLDRCFDEIFFWR